MVSKKSKSNLKKSLKGGYPRERKYYKRLNYSKELNRRYLNSSDYNNLNNNSNLVDYSNDYYNNLNERKRVYRKKSVKKKEKDDVILGCLETGYLKCGKNCSYRGMPGFGECVPKILSNELACHRRDPSRCVYPCKLQSSTGSRSRSSCKYHPVKKPSELSVYYDEVLRTKDKLVDYYELLLEKNEDISEMIEETRNDLLKKIALKKANIIKLRRDFEEFNSMTEKKMQNKKIKSQEKELFELLDEEKNIEKLVRKISLNTSKRKLKNKKLKQMIKKEIDEKYYNNNNNNNFYNNRKRRNFTRKRNKLRSKTRRTRSLPSSFITNV